MTSAPPIAFECRRSPSLLLAAIAIVILALVAVALAGLPDWLRRLLWLLVVGWGGYGITRLVLPRLRSVLWRADGGVTLVTASSAPEGGASFEGEVRGARVLGPLVVLSLRWHDGKHAALWLLPDNTDADTLRRLRIRVRAGIVDDDQAASDADRNHDL